jgi:hypothetical protein
MVLAVFKNNACATLTADCTSNIHTHMIGGGDKLPFTLTGLLCHSNACPAHARHKLSLACNVGQLRFTSQLKHHEASPKVSLLMNGAGTCKEKRSVLNNKMDIVPLAYRCDERAHTSSKSDSV